MAEVKTKTKVLKLLIAVIEEICFSGRQSQEYKLTAKITKGDQSYKVLVHIDRDSYNFQSGARISVWKPDALEWNQVASIPYNEMATTHGARNNQPSCFATDKDRLMKLAENILF